jgi:hypothetical protein
MTYTASIPCHVVVDGSEFFSHNHPVLGRQFVEDVHHFPTHRQSVFQKKVAAFPTDHRHVDLCTAGLEFLQLSDRRASMFALNAPHNPRSLITTVTTT